MEPLSIPTAALGVHAVYRLPQVNALGRLQFLQFLQFLHVVPYLHVLLFFMTVKLEVPMELLLIPTVALGVHVVCRLPLVNALDPLQSHLPLQILPQIVH